MKGIKKWPPNLCVNKSRLFIGFDYRRRACDASAKRALLLLIMCVRSLVRERWSCFGAALQHKICTAGLPAEFITSVDRFFSFRRRFVSLYLSALIWQKPRAALTTRDSSRSQCDGCCWFWVFLLRISNTHNLAHRSQRRLTFSFDDP